MQAEEIRKMFKWLFRIGLGYLATKLAEEKSKQI